MPLLLAGLISCEAYKTEYAPPTVNSLDRAFFFGVESFDSIHSCVLLESGENTQVLDGVLHMLFPTGAGALSDEARALRILNYVAQVLSGKLWVDARLGSEYLAQKGGYCVGAAHAFVSLCRRAGIPARTLSMENITVFRGHMTAEVFYDSTWHHMEPSYGLFFYTAEHYGGSGRIPAFKEVLAEPELRQYCLRVDAPLWRGYFEEPKDWTPRPISADFKAPESNEPLLGQYLTLFQESFPNVHGPETSASHPVRVDLTQVSEVWIGAKDGKDLDQYGVQSTDMKWPRHYGIRQIGKTREHNAFATCFVRLPGPGRFRVTLHFLAPDTKHKGIGVVELLDVSVGRVESRPEQWRGEFLAKGSEAVFILAHQSGLSYIDAIHVQRF